MKIELPWPPAELSPNSRAHWAVKHRAEKQAKEDAYYMTLSYSFDEWEIPEKIAVTYTFYPPTATKRDDDNFISRMKWSRDSIAAALQIDDVRMHTQPVEWGEVTARGKVVVELKELEEMQHD